MKGFHLILNINGSCSICTIIDAATEGTYTAIRRGGSFQKLLESLGHISQFRKQGLIKKLTLAFVVQKANYREMSAFVRMAGKFNADVIRFSTMNNPDGFISSEEFQQQRVWDPGHPQHEEFRKCLADPILNTPNVDLYGLTYLHREKDTATSGLSLIARLRRLF